MHSDPNLQTRIDPNSIFHSYIFSTLFIFLRCSIFESRRFETVKYLLFGYYYITITYVNNDINHDNNCNLPSYSSQSSAVC